jgi:hypothetical protein
MTKLMVVCLFDMFSPYIGVILKVKVVGQDIKLFGAMDAQHNSSVHEHGTLWHAIHN